MEFVICTKYHIIPTVFKKKYFCFLFLYFLGNICIGQNKGLQYVHRSNEL